MKKCSTKENLSPIIDLKGRHFSNKYYLTDKFNTQQQVCLGFLLNCLRISQAWVFNASKTILSNETATEKRGKFSTRKTDDSDVVYVKSFISKFPSYESHYKISRSNKKYLSPFLNLKRMYREYEIQCNFEKRNKVKEWKFRQIFDTEFNLSFAPLKVDTCRKCDEYNAKKNSASFQQRQKLDQKWKRHLDIDKKVKKDFTETVEMASNPENKTEVFTFDLQRALELPSLKTKESIL